MIGEEMRGFLLGWPGVVAEVDTRIYPSPLPQGALLPSVTFTDVSDVQFYTNANDSCYRQMRYQLDTWAQTRLDAVRVENTLRDAMSGYSGQWGAHVIGFVKRAVSSTHFEPETQLWRIRSDYMVHVTS